MEIPLYPASGRLRRLVVSFGVKPKEVRARSEDAAAFGQLHCLFFLREVSTPNSLNVKSSIPGITAVKREPKFSGLPVN